MQARLKKFASILPLGAALAVLALGACTDRDAPTAPSPTVPERRPLIIPTVYTAVSAGSYHSCALRGDGSAVCWGDTQNGKASPPPGPFTTIGAGAQQTCALRPDGTAVCWGLDMGFNSPPPGPFVALSTSGYSSCALRPDGSAACWSEEPQLMTPPPGAFTSISVGSYFACALTAAGTPVCWGESVYGKTSPPPGPFTALSLGSNHGCGLRPDGTIACWGGNNLFGEATPPAGSFVAVSAGGSHTCALRIDGAATCWGLDSHGEATPPAGPFIALSAGFIHTCGLQPGGIAVCWGLNSSGQTSVGPRALPTATFTASTSVIVGQPIALALTNAQVPGFPSATGFTYAFDCGAGYATASGASSANCATTTSGMKTVKGKVIDSDGDASEYSANVTVQSVPAATTQLRVAIDGSTLSPDIRKAFFAKLDAALRALEKGQTATACSALQDFINQVNAQRGKAIPTATADSWLLTAQQLRTGLGC